jgi:ATP-dependent Clp protease ATP-binding subunit ClpB
MEEALMQREIDDKLANLLLAGEVEDGSFVRVDVSADGQALLVESVREDASV